MLGSLLLGSLLLLAPADTLDAVKQDWQKLMNTGFDSDELLKVVERSFRIADADPDAEFEALSLVLDACLIPMPLDDSTAQIMDSNLTEAMDRLVEGYASDEQMTAVLVNLAFASSHTAKLKEYLIWISEESELPVIQGGSLFALVELTVGSNHSGELADSDRVQALEVIAKIEQNFGDQTNPMLRGRSFREAVAGHRFELENLRIGEVAPDIEGEDLDGTPFKLSDYRGKIVVLDFWGDW